MRGHCEELAKWTTKKVDVNHMGNLMHNSKHSNTTMC